MSQLGLPNPELPLPEFLTQVRTQGVEAPNAQLRLGWLAWQHGYQSVEDVPPSLLSNLQAQAVEMEGLFGDDSVIGAGGLSNNQFRELEAILQRDIGLMQGAADEHFGKVTSAIGDVRSAVFGGARQISEAGAHSATRLRDLSGSLVEQAGGVMDPIRQRLDVGIDSIRTAITEHGRNTDSNIRAATAALDRAVSNQVDMLDQGIRADGTRMSAEEQNALRRQLVSDTITSKAKIAAEYRTSADQQLAGLRVSLASAEQAAAATEVEGQRTVLGFMQAAGELEAQAATVENASALASAEFRAKGLTEVATLISENPRTIVSSFAGYMSLYGLAAASRQPPDNSSSMLGAAGIGAAGAVAGAALLAFSDRRLKIDIVRIGTLSNGIGVYEFQYIWGGARRVGVMADEVENVLPSAVVAGPGGFKMVDYNRVLEAI